MDPRGVIHAPDAPADLGDSAAFAALKARLPENVFAVCSPARRTRETAASLASTRSRTPVFANRILANGPGGATTTSSPELGGAYREFWNCPRPTVRPAAKALSIRSGARGQDPANLPAGDACSPFIPGTIRAVLAIALDLAPPTARCALDRPLSLTRIDRLADGWRVDAVNRR